MKNYTPPLVGTGLVFLLALVVFAFRQHAAIEALQAELVAARAAARQQQDEHARLIRARELKYQDAEYSIAQLQRELTVARAAAGLEPGRTAADVDPAYAELRRRNQRRLVQERYGDLFPRLSLAPDVLEELKRLLLELDRPTRTESEAGDSADHPAIAAHRSPAEIHHEIYRLLGYEGYQAFDRYTRELLSVRPLVRQFASDAADAGHPLSATQTDELARTMFEVLDVQTSPLATQSGADVPDPVTSLSLLDGLILTRAKDVLSAEQLTLLQQFRISEREALATWRKSLSPAENTAATGAVLPAEAP